MIITLLSQKGGVGKTTLAVHLAVEAAKGRKKSAIIDADPQASSFQWYERRKDKKNIQVVRQKEQDELREHDFLFIDTSPRIEKNEFKAIMQSDVTLIPCQPSFFDLASILESVELCEVAKKKYFIVLNRVVPRANQTKRIIASLEENKIPVCPVLIYNRQLFAEPMDKGLTAMELEAGGKAAVEIKALWNFVKGEK